MYLDREAEIPEEEKAGRGAREEEQGKNKNHRTRKHKQEKSEHGCRSRYLAQVPSSAADRPSIFPPASPLLVVLIVPCSSLATATEAELID